MKNFESLGLSDRVLKSVQSLGFIVPTPIQEQVITAVLQTRGDIIALAQTGTGKTGAFGLPLVDLLDTNSRQPEALILAPTRELCVQIEQDLRSFATHTPGFKTVAVYGGASLRAQAEAIKKGVQAVVATPGRLIDLLGRKVLDLSKIRIVVLDEADEMLNMGFVEDIEQILSETPAGRNVWLFSATMPREIRDIVKRYMHEPVEISTGSVNKTNENIEHQYYMIDARNKYPALKRMLDYHPDMYGIIFCRTKAETQDIADKLIRDGYVADCLHGDLTQMQRDKVMAAFREKTLQVLIATDVAARGIDVDDLTHVIHFHLPDDITYYTHRAGRTARAGKTGISCVLATVSDLYRIKQLEKGLRIAFRRMPVPDGMAVCERQLLNLIHRVHEVAVDHKAIAPYLAVMEEEFRGMDRNEIMQRFASLEFNRFLEYYRFASDLNVYEKQSEGRKAQSKANMAELFVNLGKMDHIGPRDLLGVLTQGGRLKPGTVGDIRMKGAYSFVEIPADAVSGVLAFFADGNIVFKGRRVRVEVQEGAAPMQKKRAHKGSSREMSGGHGAGKKKQAPYKGRKW